MRQNPKIVELLKLTVSDPNYEYVLEDDEFERSIDQNLVREAKKLGLIKEADTPGLGVGAGFRLTEKGKQALGLSSPKRSLWTRMVLAFRQSIFP